MTDPMSAKRTGIARIGAGMIALRIDAIEFTADYVKAIDLQEVSVGAGH